MLLTHDIAGFGRRFFAFLIDAIILSLISCLIFFCIDDFYYQYPKAFTLGGFALILLYFGCMDSLLTDGKTFGKSMLGIRVLSTHNNNLGILRSFARSFVFLSPLCLSSLYYWIENFQAKLVMIIIFSVITSSLLYFFIFNRNSKQSLHDLLAKSVVVDINKASAYEKEIWKYHYFFLVLFISYIVFVRISPLLLQNEDTVLYPLVHDLENNAEVIHVRAKSEIQNQHIQRIILNVYVNKPDLVKNTDFEKKLIGSIHKKGFKNIQHVSLKINSIGQFGFFISLHQKLYDLSLNDY